ncbi:MAG: xanthine dehydrogenase family protein molybdopterin-binding subunit [Bryobacteraceae bacterium]
MPDYSWPAMNKRRVMGKRLSRLDGVAKSSGRAKYNSDLNPPGLLHAVILSSPHAHAKITSIDVSAAQKMPGVTAVRVIKAAGSELNWQGTEIAAVAATTESQARDAIKAIKIQYEVLPHLVKEGDLKAAGSRARAAGEQVTGDPDKAFADAEVVSEGHYAIPVITHCCLEPHGQVIAWGPEDKIDYHPSTQSVSDIAADLGSQIKVPATNIRVHMDYMGGGFGSKFPSDLWGREAAFLSKESNGRPVKLFLDRAQELTIAGNRPSVYGNIKVAAKKDGTITAWQSQTWASGGLGGGGLSADLFPYVFRKVEHRRVNHTAVSLNMGSARAWRAPNHPQVSYLTCSALEDLAAKLNMDALDFYLKNVDLTQRPDVYKDQLMKAAALIDYKKNAHLRGDKTPGHIKRGLGIGVCTWGGLGHNSTCRTSIHPDGSIEVEIATQDLGTATRTMIAMVAAETFGLAITEINVKLGDNALPRSGASGGSTTIGGVSVSTHKSTINALGKLFDLVAPLMNTTPDQLEAVDGRIQKKGDPSKAMTWKQACQKLGTQSISEEGQNVSREALKEGLINQGASGVQMAHVSVDIDTGVVKMEKMVAVQDCGLVVNPKTAESQVYGAMILSCASALMEERITDQQTGKVLNADMEFYKLAGISDIGELVVQMDITPENDARGVIGLGEPPTIGGIAAIANAVANAIGVRVPMVPLTPNRVLAALGKATDRRMA